MARQGTKHSGTCSLVRRGSLLLHGGGVSTGHLVLADDGGLVLLRGGDTLRVLLVAACTWDVYLDAARVIELPAVTL